MGSTVSKQRAIFIFFNAGLYRNYLEQELRTHTGANWFFIEHYKATPLYIPANKSAEANASRIKICGLPKYRKIYILTDHANSPHYQTIMTHLKAKVRQTGRKYYIKLIFPTDPQAPILEYNYMDYVLSSPPQTETPDGDRPCSQKGWCDYFC